MKKSKKRGGKRGASKVVLVIAISLLILLVIGAFIINNSCKISQKEIQYSNGEFGNVNEGEIVPYAFFVQVYYSAKVWAKENVFMCEQERVGIVSNVAGFFSNILGFDKNVYDFGIDLLTGLLVGLWLTSIFAIASVEKLIFHKTKLKFLSAGLNLKDSWLGFLGDSWWKIVPIAVFYVVIMQIPIISSIISVITFEPLLGLKGGFFSWFLKSFIVAFYIGLLPTMIEEYSKFLLRKEYYKKLEKVRARVTAGNIDVEGI